MTLWGGAGVAWELRRWSNNSSSCAGGWPQSCAGARVTDHDEMNGCLTDYAVQHAQMGQTGVQLGGSWMHNPYSDPSSAE